MRSKINLKFCVLMMSIAFYACDTGEDALSTHSGIASHWKPLEINLDDSEFVVAKHVSSDSAVEIHFVELNESIVITMQHAPSINAEKLERYNSLIDEMNAGELTMDELYMRLEGPSADKTSIQKLRAALERIKTTTVDQHALTEEEEKAFRVKIEQYIQDKYGKSVFERGSAERQAQICGGVTEDAASLFEKDKCSLNSSSNKNIPGSFKSVNYCYTGWGPSTAPTTTRDYYRLWVQNPYQYGVPANVIMHISSSTVSFQVKPNKTSQYNVMTQSNVKKWSYVINSDTRCKIVHHAVLTSEIDW